MYVVFKELYYRRLELIMLLLILFPLRSLLEFGSYACSFCVSCLGFSMVFELSPLPRFIHGLGALSWWYCPYSFPFLQTTHFDWFVDEEWIWWMSVRESDEPIESPTTNWQMHYYIKIAYLVLKINLIYNWAVRFDNRLYEGSANNVI